MNADDREGGSRGRRRAVLGAQLVTIYWRDIPTQVNAQQGRWRHQVLLPKRFARAVDQAAMNAGLTTSHEYVAQMRRTSSVVSVAHMAEEDLIAAAEAEVRRIDEKFSRARLSDLVAHHGLGDGDEDAAEEPMPGLPRGRD